MPPPPRPAARPPVLIALAVVCAIASARIGRALLDSLDDPTPAVLSALADARDPDAAAPRPAHRRVVVAVLDGLGQDALESLVARGELGAWAWHARVDVGAPSLSRPVYHAIFTGVTQPVAGIRTNAQAGRARADSLVDRVRAGGGRVAWALESVDWMRELFGQPGDVCVRGPRATTEAGFAEAYRAGAALTVLHLLAVDYAGHAHGAASTAYADAALQVVRTVHVLRERVAPDAVWFVGADHGHLPRGGHGGPEPGVRRVAWYGLWPANARVGPRVDRTVPAASVASLAPTFAAELGVQAPTEALDAALPLPDGATVAQPRLALRQLAVARAFDRHARAARHARLARGALFVAALLALFALLARRGLAREVLAAALVTLAACAGFALAGPGFTLSAIRTHAYFLVRALAAMSAFALVAWPLARRLGARFTSTALVANVPLAFALATTAGSLGVSSVTPVESLVLPSTGLVPVAVLVALALAAITTRVWKSAHSTKPGRG